MNTTSRIVIVCVVLVVAAATLAKKKIVADTHVCQVSDIPAVFERLKKEGKDGSFAVFMFQPPNQPNADDAINIQFSFDGVGACLQAIQYSVLGRA